MRSVTIGMFGTILGFALMAMAHEQLPPGPVHDRHELMEDVGKNAKIIGDAMKAGETEKIPGPATLIAEAAKKVPGLFPEGSQHPKSRAKPEVWSEPTVFKAESIKLEQTATALAKAAETKGDVPQAAKEMFDSCKSCHNKFRLPEE